MIRLTKKFVAAKRSLSIKSTVGKTFPGKNRFDIESEIGYFPLIP